MPRKPKRPCSRQGCPNLCDGQYYEQHRIEERRKYDRYERSPDINKKYGHAWRRIRDRYAAAHPLCEMCLGEGRLTPVQEVHHILPVSQGGTHAMDNLMSLCQSCHTKIHHEIGDRQGGSLLYTKALKTTAWGHARKCAKVFGGIDPAGKRWIGWVRGDRNRAAAAGRKRLLQTRSRMGIRAKDR